MVIDTLEKIVADMNIYALGVGVHNRHIQTAFNRFAQRIQGVVAQGSRPVEWTPATDEELAKILAEECVIRRLEVDDDGYDVSTDSTTFGLIDSIAGRTLRKSTRIADLTTVTELLKR